MSKLINLVGKRFGYLTVIDKAEPRKKPNGDIVNYWKCKCDCGNEKEIAGYSLRRGDTVSCGCYRKRKNKKDLTGQKFSHLTVIKEVGRNKSGRVIWLCKCDCGNYHETLGKYLLNGETTSCGCRRQQILSNTINKQTTHKMSNTRIYNIWSSIKNRCNNPNDKQYKDYGGRGIKYCEEWKDFKCFYDWAINNGYEENLTIDRINTNGNYESNNCRWADRIVQCNNTRRNHYLTYNNETKTMSEWAKLYNINYSTFRARINNYNWSVKKAIETPIRPMKKSTKGEN